MTQFEPSPEGKVIAKQLGYRILEIMDEKGKAFTTQALAMRIGMNRKTLSSKLNGNRDLYLFELRRIAESLKLTLERIMQEDIRDEAYELKELFEGLRYPERAVEIAGKYTENDWDLERANLFLQTRTFELTMKFVNVAVGATERSKALNDLGRAYFYQQKYEDAHLVWMEAYRYAKKAAERENENSRTLLFNAIENLMISYSIKRESSHLSDILIDAEPLMKHAPERSAVIRYSLAKIAEQKKDFTTAREHYYASLDGYIANNQMNMIARAYHNTACFEYRQGNYQKARELFELAKIGLENDHYAYLIWVKEYGKVLLKLGETEPVPTLIRESLKQVAFLSMAARSELEAKLFLLLARATNNPHYAEEIVSNDETQPDIRNLALTFLLNHYEDKGDSKRLMHYYKLVRELSPNRRDILDEEGL
jgi:tetratricopeptide (TPR) repeat protein